tara:strand:- start:780 stop:959 length:180 start_codon:yes stop_codon:yes gene_type:complete
MKEIRELIRVKTYADLHKVTTTSVYRWLDKKMIKSVDIDGVTFIKKGATITAAPIKTKR